MTDMMRNTSEGFNSEFKEKMLDSDLKNGLAKKESMGTAKSFESLPDYDQIHKDQGLEKIEEGHEK